MKEIKLLEASGLTEFNAIFRRRRRNVIWYLSKIAAIEKDIARYTKEKPKGYKCKMPLLRFKKVDLEKRLKRLELQIKTNHARRELKRRPNKLKYKKGFSKYTLIELLNLRSFKQIGYTTVEEVMNSSMAEARQKVKATFPELTLTIKVLNAIVNSINAKSRKILGKTHVYPTK